jgi:hypothetical protein
MTDSRRKVAYKIKRCNERNEVVTAREGIGRIMVINSNAIAIIEATEGHVESTPVENIKFLDKHDDDGPQYMFFDHQSVIKSKK